MREIKFRAWDSKNKKMYSFELIELPYSENINLEGQFDGLLYMDYKLMQYTGLKDKNGKGLTEVYEGDIIDENGIIKGSIYEVDARKTDIIIPQLGTKDWESAYKKAVVRGFDYSE